jgi:hypothetical protein
MILNFNADMPDMSECSGFWGMCNLEAVYTAFPTICSKTGKAPQGESSTLIGQSLVMAVYGWSA